MNQEFFQWFKTTEMYCGIMQQYHPDLILLEGSRTMGAFTEKSDYDIVVYTRYSTYDQMRHRVKTRYKDCVIHAFIINIENYFKMLKNSIYIIDDFYQYCGVASLINKKQDEIIYKTQRGQDFLDFFNIYGQDLLHIGIAGLCKSLYKELDAVVAENSYITFENKKYFHLLMAYQKLHPEQDIIPLIKEFRLKRSECICEEYRTRVIQIAQELLDFYRNSDFNREVILLNQMEDFICHVLE